MIGVCAIRLCAVQLVRRVFSPNGVFAVDSAHWDGRGAIRSTADLRSTPERVKRREEAARWDRLLALDPPPRSWER
jgi:hypothetical protein